MGVRNAYQQAADYQNRIRSYYTPDLPYILATEVLEEIARQCRSGKQYLTFPNRISAEEKAKLEAKNYIVTENTIQSKNRDGIGDEYIGFQVALNATAASDYRPMTISEEETNGISGGGGGGGDTGYAIGDAVVVLDGAMRYTIGIAEFSPVEEDE